MYNCQGEPLSIHVFMNILLNFEGVVYQAKCIQWEKKKYELLINADREKLKIEEVLAAYRKYLGEIPVQSSGKFMVCENRCPDYQ